MQNKQNRPGDEYEKHVAESGGDYQVVKAGKYETIIAKVLCVLAAVILWFYVVSTDTTTKEKTFSGVKVDIRNLERIEEELGMSIITGYDSLIDLTVNGPNAEINRLSLDSISVYVDVSNVNEAGEYTLEVHTSVPVGINVISQSVDYLNVYIDRRTSISVPVKVVPTYSIETSYTLGEPEPSLEMVSVTGPEAELSRVAYAQVSLDLGQISKTLNATGKLVLFDANGTEITSPYVKLQTTEVSVRVPVYAYKDVALAVDYKYGYYNNSNVSVKITPASIRIKGDPDVLADMDTITIYQLDEKKIIEDTTISTSIMLSDDMENVSGIKTAEIKVTHMNTETRKVTISNLIANNPNNLNYSLDTSEIEITFRGTRALLALLNNSNVTVTIDLGYLNKAVGKVQVPVTITLSSALVGNVYEIGEYKMNVTING
ncbi:MAG: hypothetical protein IJ493_08155 [Clostridia bacterium]|nr:hypothetical protein [Clostridia bacterium]